MHKWLLPIAVFWLASLSCAALRADENPQVDDLQARILADPSLQTSVSDLQNDEQVQGVLNDPEVQRALRDGDTAALMQNPKVQDLTNNPAVQNLTDKVSH